MNKKILIINDFGHANGGASSVAIESAIELSKRNFKIIFLCATAPIDEKLLIPNISVICLNEMECLHRPIVIGAISSIFNIKTFFAIKKIITASKQENINLTVMVHGWTKALSPSIFACLLLNKVKFNIIGHDYFTVCPNGALFNFKKQRHCGKRPMSLGCLIENCDSRNYLFKIFRAARQMIQNQITTLAAQKNLMRILGVSNRSVIEIRKHANFNAEFTTIGNPVQLKSKYSRVKSEENSDILVIGRLEPEKGVMKLAETCAKNNLPIRFIGDGSLRNMIQQSNKSFSVTGWLSQDQVEQEILKARFIIFPSLCLETFGLTVVQALSLGVPCLISNQCVSTEFVSKYADLLVYDPFSPEDTLNKISRLNNNATIHFLSKKIYDDYRNSKLNNENYYGNLSNIIID